MREISVQVPIKLNQFLKITGLFTGGEGKAAIQNGQIKVNGQLTTARGQKLQAGDRVETTAGQQFLVRAAEETNA